MKVQLNLKGWLVLLVVSLATRQCFLLLLTFPLPSTPPQLLAEARTQSISFININIKNFFLAVLRGMWGISSLICNQIHAPLEWKHGVLTPGPPGKSQSLSTWKMLSQETSTSLAPSLLLLSENRVHVFILAWPLT